MREVLVPTLRPGQQVIGAILRGHRGETARTLIEAAGCPRHVRPASSLDRNPIELAFSTLHTLRRRRGARTRDGLDDAITAALPQLIAANAQAWIAVCGYRHV